MSLSESRETVILSISYSFLSLSLSLFIILSLSLSFPLSLIRFSSFSFIHAYISSFLSYRSFSVLSFLSLSSFFNFFLPFLLLLLFISLSPYPSILISSFISSPHIFSFHIHPSFTFFSQSFSRIFITHLQLSSRSPSLPPSLVPLTSFLPACIKSFHLVLLPSSKGLLSATSLGQRGKEQTQLMTPRPG